MQAAFIFGPGLKAYLPVNKSISKLYAYLNIRASAATIRWSSIYQDISNLVLLKQPSIPLMYGPYTRPKGLFARK